MAGLVGHAAWHLLIDTDGVRPVIALYDKYSLIAFQSSGYERVDRMGKLFVPFPGLPSGNDFKGKRNRMAKEIVAAHHLGGSSAGYR